MEKGSGICGKCGSEDIDYGGSEIVDDSLSYLFHCNKCGADGTEWYDLTYSETIMEEDDE